MSSGDTTEGSPDHLISSLLMYEESLLNAISFRAIPISLTEIKRVVPFDTWKELDCARLYSMIEEYVMSQEIDYLLKLFDLPLTKEVILQHVTSMDWWDYRNLYRKTLVLWNIAVFTRAKYYYETLGLEKLTPSIQENIQRLEGVAFTNINFNDEQSLDEIYQGICIMRARCDLKTPIRSAHRLRPVMENTKLTESKSNRAISLIAMIVWTHEGLVDVPPVISGFTKKLSSECLALSREVHSEDVEFWDDVRDTLESINRNYPDASYTDHKRVTFHHAWYFHPRHSENPEDHYRFIMSSIYDDDKKAKIMELFNRISEKKFLPREFLDKRDMFTEVHQELLMSPNLPLWFKNDYTCSKEHFDGLSLEARHGDPISTTT